MGQTATYLDAGNRMTLGLLFRSLCMNAWSAKRQGLPKGYGKENVAVTK